MQLIDVFNNRIACDKSEGLVSVDEFSSCVIIGFLTEFCSGY